MTDRAAYWKAFDARRQRYEGRATSDALTVLEEIGEQAASLIDANGLLTGQILSEQMIEQDGRREMMMFYERTYGVVVPAFADEVFRSIKSGRGPESTKQDDVWLHSARQWLVEHGAEMVSRITDTTLALFRQVLDEGVEEGEGSEVIARELNRQWPEISRMRARRIGRTEVIRASSFGAQTGAEQVRLDTGLELNKVWISTRDSRVRESHGSIDGQTVGLDAPFNVGGWSAMYPADASLPASQSVNCRCSHAFEVVD